MNVTLSLDSDSSSVGIKEILPDGSFKYKTIESEQLKNLFTGNWKTPLMSVNGDGIVYIEDRDGILVVVAQFCKKKAFPIKWRLRNLNYKETEYKATIPYTYMVFQLTPHGNGYNRERELFGIAPTPAISMESKLYEGQNIVGNLYNFGDSFGGRNSNVCWGTTAIIPPKTPITINSTKNIVADFYAQPFTDHLLQSMDPLLEYTKSDNLLANIPRARAMTLGNAIESFWKGRYIE